MLGLCCGVAAKRRGKRMDVKERRALPFCRESRNVESFSQRARADVLCCIWRNMERSPLTEKGNVQSIKPAATSTPHTSAPLAIAKKPGSSTATFPSTSASSSGTASAGAASTSSSSSCPPAGDVLRAHYTGKKAKR